MSVPYHVRLAIDKFGDEYRAELFTEDLGESDGDPLPEQLETLETLWEELGKGASRLPEESARILGGEMFSALLGKAKNRRKWTECVLQASRRGRPIRLLIDAQAEPARDFPFGLLRDPNAQDFLFSPSDEHPETRLVRIVGRSTPKASRVARKAAAKEPIKILLAVAETLPPPDEDAPGLLFWMGNLAAELSEMSGAYEIYLVGPNGATPLNDLAPGRPEEWDPQAFEPYCRADRQSLRLALLEGGCDALHLIVHGESEYVILCDPEEARVGVLGAELAEWCAVGDLDMAFLQICETNLDQEPGRFGSLAQILLDPRGGNLSAVVAPSCPIPAESGAVAAFAFYRNLAAAKPLDHALERPVPPPIPGPSAAAEGEAEPRTVPVWAYLELWVRPGALERVESAGALQFVSPYRGLSSFDERDADVFHGRASETAELIRILENETVLVVAGDPGSGKSSLLQAGLAYNVRRNGLAGRTDWQIFTFRPGAQPPRNLIATLLGDEVSSPEDVPSYEDWRPPLRSLLGTVLQTEQSAFLMIDQFEECFTLCENVGHTWAMAETLAEAAMAAPDRFRLILAVRGEFIGETASLPGLTELIHRPWVMRPPGPDQLREIISEPAEAFGYAFEEGLEDSRPEHTEGLLDRILKEPLLTSLPARAYGSSESGKTAKRINTPLPLIEFALERLWLQALDRGSNLMTHADYDKIGGLGGAIAIHAEETYQSLSDDPAFGAAAQEMARRVFTNILTARGLRRPRSRVELETMLGDRTLARHVIDRLVAERLLTIRSDPDDLAISLVEITHEVLSERWDRLREWMSEGFHRLDYKPAPSPSTTMARDPALSSAVIKRIGGESALSSAVIKRISHTLEAARSTGGSSNASGFQRALVELAQERRNAEVGPPPSSKRRGLTVIAGVAAASFLLASTFGVWQWLARKGDAERLRVARAEAASAQEQVKKLERGRSAPASTKFAPSASQSGGSSASSSSYSDDLLAAGSSWLEGNLTRMRSALERQRSESAAATPFEWRFLWRLADYPARTPRSAQPQPFPIAQTGRSRASALAASPNGGTAFIPSAREPGRISVIDLNGSALERTFVEGQGEVHCLAISPDGSTLAGGVEDSTLRLWNAKTGQERAKAACKGPITAAVWAPDGSKLATLTPRELIVWSISAGTAPPTALWRAPVQASALAIGPNAIATGDAEGVVRLWDLAAGSQTRLVYGGYGRAPIRALAFSPDGGRFASAGDDRYVSFFATATGRRLDAVCAGHQGPIWDIAFSADGRKLVSASADRTARVWDVASTRAYEIVNLRGNEHAVEAVEFADNARTVVTSCRNGAIRMWSASYPGQDPLALSGFSRDPKHLIFSPDGTWIASDDGAGEVWLWDAVSGRSLGKQPDPNCLALGPQGKTLVSALPDGGLRIRNVDGASPAPRTLASHSAPVRRAIFSEDGAILASGGADRRLIVWNVAAGKPKTNSETFEGRISEIAISAEKGTGCAAFIGSNGFAKVAVLDLNTGKTLKLLETESGEIVRLALSRDAKRLAAIHADGASRIWGLPDGEAIKHHPAQTLAAGDLGDRGQRAAIAMEPGFERLIQAAAGSSFQAVDLWTGQSLLTVAAHPSAIISMELSPDGRTLATAGLDRRVKIWKAPEPRP